MKVLIAEDNPMWRKMLERLIFNWGYEPVVAENGRQAWKILQDPQAPRLAVLDWQMPELDGIDVCRRVKNNEEMPFTYVMMLTSRDAEQDMVAGLDAGADDYLTKPIEPPVLRSRLSAAKRIVELVPPKGWTAPPIPDFDIQKLIGKGAFATVWEGVHRTTGERAAIKVMRVDLATDEVFNRFAQEIKIMQRMDHASIAKIYESQIDRTLGYFAMELVDGETLDKYVKRCKPKATKLLGLIAQVSDALHYAHEQGVVHRDLKPSNILITENTQPKLVDFGLAKTLFRAGPEPGPDDSNDGEVIGTPLFMAPEQARGEDANQDGRTDVYALGIVVYVMLLRKHPHNISHSDRWATIRAIAGGEIRPPRDVHPKFNPDLERILLKALHKDPDSRFASAAEFSAVIRDFLEKRAASKANAKK